MSDTTYTATLDDGTSTEQVELESIQGEPQKSFVRTAEVDGREVEVTWELDADAEGTVYRPAEGDGYGS